MSEYLIPAGSGEASFVEKRSEFLGHVRFADNEDDAKAFVAEMKKKYYDARHNCWCYIIKDGAVRYSDDGEPQGTAGLPMLEVFKREGIENVVCVVTRYFGGILLGTGGLLRAYTKSAADALTAAGMASVRRWSEYAVFCSYSLLERVKNAVTEYGGSVTDIEYSADVTVTALIPEENGEDFCVKVTDISSATAETLLCGTKLLPVRIK